MGKAFYKGYVWSASIHVCSILTSDSGFDPRMSRREASLILELPYALSPLPLSPASFPP